MFQPKEVHQPVTGSNLLYARLRTSTCGSGRSNFVGGEGGGRTHTKSELRQILSLVRLPVPPLRLSAPPLYRQADEAQPISSERQPTFCLAPIEPPPYTTAEPKRAPERGRLQ
jgi:hypothetical protein